MVNTNDIGDAVELGVIAGIDERISKTNNPLTSENFYVQGHEKHIFFDDADNLDNKLFYSLYSFLVKKRIIVRVFTFSTIITLDYKFITSNKDLLTVKSLKENLHDFTDKNKVDYENLSNFLLTYKYSSLAQPRVFELLNKEINFKKSLKKKGGKHTRNKNRNQRNKSVSRKKKYYK